MKKTTSFLAAALLLIAAAFNTQAQIRYSDEALSAIPATLATTVDTNFPTSSTGTRIDCRFQRDVTVTFMFNQSGASTSNVVYALRPSVNGTDIGNSSPSWVVTIPSQGTTIVKYTTNFNVGGAGYLHLVAISNTTALTTFTNQGVIWGRAIGTPK